MRGKNLMSMVAYF